MSTKKQRRKLANELATIATASGAVVEVSEDGRRGTRVDCEWPGKVRCGFDIDDLHQGGVLFSWHRAEKRLQMGPWFSSVNTYHGTKATSFGHNEGLAKKVFREGCEAVADGRAFVSGSSRKIDLAHSLCDNGVAGSSEPGDQS